VNGECKVGLQ